MPVCPAVGCEVQQQPPFLRDLGLGAYKSHISYHALTSDMSLSPCRTPPSQSCPDEVILWVRWCVRYELPTCSIELCVR